MGLKKIPLRMCVVCREMKEKKTLLRVVRTPDGEIRVDESGRVAGRGAYICGSGACLEKCIKQRAINRAFKCEAGGAVYESLKERLNGERQ